MQRREVHIHHIHRLFTVGTGMHPQTSFGLFCHTHLSLYIGLKRFIKSVISGNGNGIEYYFGSRNGMAAAPVDHIILGFLIRQRKAQHLQRRKMQQFIRSLVRIPVGNGFQHVNTGFGHTVSQGSQRIAVMRSGRKREMTFVAQLTMILYQCSMFRITGKHRTGSLQIQAIDLQRHTAQVTAGHFERTLLARISS